MTALLVQAAGGGLASGSNPNLGEQRFQTLSQIEKELRGR